MKNPKTTTPRTPAIQEAVDALTKIEKQFMFYADEHRKAGKTEKAATNYGYVLIAARALEHLKITTHCDHTYIEIPTSIEPIEVCTKCQKDLLP